MSRGNQVMANRDEREEAEEEIQSKKKCSWLYSGVFLQAFALNFFAEWGDTSQITTILLAGNYPLLSGKGFDYPSIKYLLAARSVTSYALF